VPIYEYECKKCHHRFERIQKFSDPPLKKCPECGSSRVEKLLSSPAVHFKGSGWDVTDYGRKGSGGKGKDKEGKDRKESSKETGQDSGKEADKKPSASDSAGSTSSRKDSKDNKKKN